MKRSATFLKCFSVCIILVVFGFVSKACNSEDPALPRILSKKVYEKWFPKRNRVYSYEGFLKACEKFPAFLNEGNSRTKKNELAAFLANVAQETTGGWNEAPGGPMKWGLFFAEEQACIKGNCDQYNSPGRSAYVAASGKNYYGRGAMQLTYLYNYGEAGKDLDLPLVEKPELMSTDSIIAFETAIWFWMRSQNNKPSCHDVICGIWKPNEKDLAAGRNPGFAMVINVINGGLECGNDRSSEAVNKLNGRIEFYRFFCKNLKIKPDSNCDCKGMAPYIMSENALILKPPMPVQIK